MIKDWLLACIFIAVAAPALASPIGPFALVSPFVDSQGIWFYTVASNGTLLMDGSSSLAEPGFLITRYDWDLDNDGNFDEANIVDPTGVVVQALGVAPLDVSSAFPSFSYTNLNWLPFAIQTVGLRVTDNRGFTSTTAFGSSGVIRVGEPSNAVTPVPEPSSFLLLGIGAAGLLMKARRRLDWFARRRDRGL